MREGIGARFAPRTSRVPPRSSVPEMTYPCKHHSYAMLVRRRYHFRIAQASTGLDDRLCACFRNDIEPVPEWKESVRCDDRPYERKTRALRFHRGDAR